MSTVVGRRIAAVVGVVEVGGVGGVAWWCRRTSPRWRVSSNRSVVAVVFARG